MIDCWHCGNLPFLVLGTLCCHESLKCPRVFPEEMPVVPICESHTRVASRHDPGTGLRLSKGDVGPPNETNPSRRGVKLVILWMILSRKSAAVDIQLGGCAIPDSRPLLFASCLLPCGSPHSTQKARKLIGLGFRLPCLLLSGGGIGMIVLGCATGGISGHDRVPQVGRAYGTVTEVTRGPLVQL